MRNKCTEAYQEVLSTGRLNSDNYSLADFYEMESNDIFDKTRPFQKHYEDYMRKEYYTYQRLLLTACKNRVIIQDPFTGRHKEMIMMGSNNYLNLTTHPKVIKAGLEAYRKFGSGPGSVPLFAGTYDITRELELKLAEFKNCEDAIVFPSGYSANVGTISALLRPGDVAIVDKLDHASIIDGCRLSGASMEVFRHQDMSRLKKCMDRCSRRYKGKLIIVDGVYSMLGDICNLPEIKDIADFYGAKVMVDDAHASGVIGLHGKGTADHFGMEGKVDLVIGTLSKTLGATGGFLASTTEIVRYLRFYARSFFFSTSIQPSTSASVKAAIEVIEEEPGRREQLHLNVRYLYELLSSLGFKITPPGTGILNLTIGEELTLRKISKKIHDSGLFINPVTFPAVPKGEAGFRISLMAEHTQEDLDEAANIIGNVCMEFNVIESKRFSAPVAS
jgi:glycine C-acetyltransferase